MVDAGGNERFDAVAVEGSQLQLDGGVSGQQAGCHVGQRRRRRARPVRRHDGHTLVAGGPRQVVQQPQRRLVGVVEVVDRQQHPVRPGGEADELGAGHEQPLVTAQSGPVAPVTGEHSVDLRPVAVGQPVEERGVVSADIGQCFDHRGVRPRRFDSGRRAVTDSPAALDRGSPGVLEHGRLADAWWSGDEQRRRPSACDVGQQRLDGGALPLAADQRRSPPGWYRGGQGEAITQLLRLGARRHAQLPTQDAIEALVLADRGVTVAGVGVQAHQRDMSGLVGGVEIHDVAPPAGEPQEVQMT